MALALLTLLSVTTRIQVETNAASTRLNHLRAQESANLALMVALGDLQRHAGPDQRVTARAEILGEGNYAPNSKFWTGVWNTAKPTAAPTWLVSGINPDPTLTRIPTMQLVGPGSAGTDITQHVFAPKVKILGRDSNVTSEISWWISDEGVKASLGDRPLHLRRIPNFLKESTRESLKTMIATDQGLEGLFNRYDRFTSTDARRSLDRLVSLSQLFGQSDFSNAETQNLSAQSAYHSLTEKSLGVLSSVLPNNSGGLLQDLSMFPQLIGSKFEERLRRAEATAERQSKFDNAILQKRHLTQLRGLDDVGTLADGDIASPITPILSSFMMAFTLRSHSPIQSNPNFYLRMRFFCEFWNPYTSTIAMTNASGHELDLELEITGLPNVAIEKTTGAHGISNPIKIQDLLKDPTNTDQAMIIRLQYDQNEEWLPGQSKNWTGINAASATEATPVIATGASPYHSFNRRSKSWNASQNTLGGITGIDTGEPRLPGDIRHTSLDSNSLSIKIYRINKTSGDRSLLTELDGIIYKKVSTRPTGYSHNHSGSTFGYHFILRGPHLSSSDPEYYRGLWLKDHDPRNPKPDFPPDWNLDNDPTNHIGSAYAPIKNGITPLLIPDPSEINETNHTINTVVFRRFMDRSNSNAFPISENNYNKLWQDAPLFEIPRERPLSLASLQHLYFHNERPFKVGNSWGANGPTNTLAWFDRYYFSGFSRNDNPEEYDASLSLPNPSLVSYKWDSPATDLSSWQAASSNNPSLSKDLASKALIRNRFNLNSTSVLAWKVVLGSLRTDKIRFLNYPEEDTSDLSTLQLSEYPIDADDPLKRRAMFSRFSQSLGETFEAPQTPAFEGTEPVAPSAYYRRGARYFDQAELEALATEIVNLIKKRGKPFQSMEEFLSVDTSESIKNKPQIDASLLEQAIKATFAKDGRQKWDHQWETQGIRSAHSDIIDIDHFSPGFLTQADVMTAIGPMLSPRSDTFKIRARAQTYSQQGLATANAAIEATFQRIPTPVDPSTSVKRSNKRRFILLSKKWLKEEEL